MNKLILKYQIFVKNNTGRASSNTNDLKYLYFLYTFS